jgi:putative ATP-dependent endonuclease of OLD family
MYLASAIIENYRGFKRIDLGFDATTVLIGENNTGKTSLLDGIRAALSRQSRRGFEDHDYYLASDKSRPGEAGALMITLDFAEQKSGDWSQEVIQTLADAIVFQGTERHVTLRIESSFDKKTNDFVTDWNFLDAAGKPLSKAKRAGNLFALQQLNPVHYLTALRDAGREFNPRSGLWAPFLRNPQIPAATQQQLEKELSQLNDKILNAEPRLQGVKQNLSKAQKLVSLSDKDTVTISALPTKVWDMLSRSQVNVAGATGANLPLERHGAGTQSLAVVFLFEAFLESGIGKPDPFSEPILEIEEPEAHLHPAAVRALWNTLTSLKGQKIIATHSGELLSEVPLQAVRRFRRSGGTIEVRALKPSTLNPDELRKVHFHLRRTRAELLFARCWLLVEGETEYWILAEAARIVGMDLEQAGIRIVDHAQVGSPVTFAKLADDFGIAWHCICDGDPAGQQNRASLIPQLGGRAEQDHITTLPASNMELLLCNSGYGGVYVSNMSPHKLATVTIQPGQPGYWEQVLKAQPKTYKVQCAVQVVAEMAKPGSTGVPAVLQQALQNAQKLAGA